MINDSFDLFELSGLKGRTSTSKSCYDPTWNEQIVLTEMFPPLCRRLRIQVRQFNESGYQRETMLAHEILQMAYEWL